jgi:hypothetical protein
MISSHRGSLNVGNGQKTQFWEDSWLGEQSLAYQYPSLYNIVRRNNSPSIKFKKELYSITSGKIGRTYILQHLISIHLMEDPSIKLLINW